MTSSRLKAAPTERAVLAMPATTARTFFLKPESYCRLDLPPYFNFGGVLRPVRQYLARHPVGSNQRELRGSEGVNHTIYSNKDGRYAWRPFQLVHPVLYVDLVNLMTEANAWAAIRARFSEFAGDPRIRCLSIPQESRTKRRDQGAQILHWWQGIEQASIELALDFNFVLHADITDCYASLYTHTIAWAIHGKPTAKKSRRDLKLLGNAIDGRIQDMHCGQTNGIPQGSVLLDLVAELVLGYADMLLSERLAKAGVAEYQVLRYRDDYRIFVKDSLAGERVLKALTEVLIPLGFRLNASKTTDAQAIIGSSLKLEKREWMRGRQGDSNLQKHLLLIQYHGVEYPNAGSLLGALDAFHRRLVRMKVVQNPIQLISIAVDIGFNNPRCIPVCAAIVSKLLAMLRSSAERRAVVGRVQRRLAQLPNSGHLEVWLQRITYRIDPKIAYDEKLCRVVRGEDAALWNSSWITDTRLREVAHHSLIVDRAKLQTLRGVVSRSEYSVFGEY